MVDIKKEVTMKTLIMMLSAIMATLTQVWGHTINTIEYFLTPQHQWHSTNVDATFVEQDLYCNTATNNWSNPILSSFSSHKTISERSQKVIKPAPFFAPKTGNHSRHNNELYGSMNAILHNGNQRGRRKEEPYKEKVEPDLLKL